MQMSEVLHVNHSGTRASAISLLLLLVAIPCTAQVTTLVEHHDNNHATKQVRLLHSSRWRFGPRPGAGVGTTR